jgi:hypothetical protein
LEVDNLSEVMAIKADMRRLRLRTLESGPGRIVFSLGHETELDPQKLTGLVQRSIAFCKSPSPMWQLPIEKIALAPWPAGSRARAFSKLAIASCNRPRSSSAEALPYQVYTRYLRELEYGCLQRR